MTAAKLLLSLLGAGALAGGPLADAGVTSARAAGAATPPPALRAAADTGVYPNLFRDYLGKSDAEIAARVDAAWTQLFHGDPDSQVLYYPVPGDMAYVPDININDVRSEGLSYGMMIAVQLNHREEFDRIWRFARHYLYYDAGPFRGYFAWHTAYDGRRLSPGPAPDGEEWFVTALFFASHRWGDGAGIFAYGAEAQALLHTMLHKHEEPDRGPVGDMFDRDAKQVVFVPEGPGSGFSDPSYFLPHFYELWARWAADPADRAFCAELAATARAMLHRIADPRTGLMPDYANFDGTPHRAPWGRHDCFLYDAWRTLSNPAIDHVWWAADPWVVGQSNRVLAFLASRQPDVPDRFQLDGTPISTDVNTPGLVATSAVAALAADRAIGEPFVRRFWAMPVPSGRLRYYDGLLTMLAWLQLSGNFRIYGPPAATP